MSALISEGESGEELEVLRTAFEIIADATGALFTCTRIALDLYAKRYPLWGAAHRNAQAAVRGRAWMGFAVVTAPFRSYTSPQ